MLEYARSQFAGNKNLQIVEADLDRSLPELGTFDAIVSSFAIHHCSHERKRSLYEEIYKMLTPGGVFCNLEHVASPTYRLHEQFMKSIGEQIIWQMRPICLRRRLHSHEELPFFEEPLRVASSTST
jgi:tRNA (cmo5U34)-methyltransferase